MIRNMAENTAEIPVSEIMDSDPATVGRDTDVRTAIEMLRSHELPGLPVVDGDGGLVGILTESDLVIRGSEQELQLPHFINLLGGIVFIEPFKGFEQRLRKAFATRVEDMMTADPITCRPEESVREVARRIAESKHNRLPVVDDNGKLVGVVTRVDVLSALAAG